MAYSDPQSVTVNTVAHPLPRTGSTDSSGTFRSSDQRYKLLVSHTNGRRVKHVARLEFADIVANALVPSQNSAVDAAVTFTVNRPLNGMSTEQVQELAKGLVSWLSTANLAKLVGGEN